MASVTRRIESVLTRQPSPDTPAMPIYTDSTEFYASDEYAPVDTVVLTDLDRSDGLVTQHFDVTMTNGMTHPGIVVLPERGVRRKLPRSDILRLGNTAWTTSVRGYNHEVQREEAARYGIPSVSLGVHKNLTRFGTIGGYGHTSLEVGKHMARRYDLNTSLVTASGDSRGAEITTATASFAHLHDMTVGFADAKALCGVEAVPLTPPSLMRFVWGLRNELTDGVKEIARNPHGRLWRMKDTFDFSPRMVVQQAKDASALKTNDAHQILRRYADPDMFIYFSIDRRDSLAKAKLWEAAITSELFDRAMLDIFEGDNIDKGSHIGSCAGPRALEARMERIAQVYGLIHDFGESLPQDGSARVALHEAAIRVEGSDFQRIARRQSALAQVALGAHAV